MAVQRVGEGYPEEGEGYPEEGEGYPEEGEGCPEEGEEEVEFQGEGPKGEGEECHRKKVVVPFQAEVPVPWKTRVPKSQAGR